jgi:hypothetical protein
LGGELCNPIDGKAVGDASGNNSASNGVLVCHEKERAICGGLRKTPPACSLLVLHDQSDQQRRPLVGHAHDLLGLIERAVIFLDEANLFARSFSTVSATHS